MFSQLLLSLFFGLIAILFSGTAYAQKNSFNTQLSIQKNELINSSSEILKNLSEKLPEKLSENGQKKSQEDIKVSNEPWLKIRLQIAQTEVMITGTEFVFNEKPENYQFVSLKKDQQVVRITPVEKGFLVIQGEQQKIYAGQEILLEGKNLVSEHHPLPNKIILSKNKNGFDVIGLVGLEQYVAGVVASELPAKFPFEALKAQAIAARSYALAIRKERQGRTFHLENTILDQVFEPWKQQPEHLKKAMLAVIETKGMVLQGEDPTPIKAYYHAHCGGSTARAQDVWGAGNSYGTVTGDLCQVKYPKTWTYEIGLNEIGDRLQKKIKNQLDFFDLVPVRKGFRIFSLELRSQSGLAQKFLAQELREAIGFKVLKSTSFEIKKNESKLTFLGKGFGHGVGLCQWGSRAHAESGKDFKYILHHYYPKANIAALKVSDFN